MREGKGSIILEAIYNLRGAQVLCRSFEFRTDVGHGSVAMSDNLLSVACTSPACNTNRACTSVICTYV